MNTLDKILLRFFLLPVAFYRKVGIDKPQLEAILSAKLTMDNRRPLAFARLGRRGEKKELNTATLKTMVFSLLMGFFLIAGIKIGEDMVTRLTVFISTYLIMLCLMLIADFTSVLIDVRDNYIILPKPVTDATFLMSRLLHIAIRVCVVMVPLSLPTCLMACVQEGWTLFLPFLLVILLSSLFGIFLINAVYILILKMMDPVKFQSAISYFQIVFTVMVFAGYQMLPVLINKFGLLHASVLVLQNRWLYPPFWFADACMAIQGMDFSNGKFVSVALALFVPLFSLWLVIRYLAPFFNQKMTLIAAGSAEQSRAVVKKQKRKLGEKLASFFTKPGAEYVGFVFCWKMMFRSRDFKLKVYPSFGSAFVLCVLFLYNFGENSFLPKGEALWLSLLLIIYICCLIPMTALMQLPYSEKFKASWVFHAMPIESPGVVIAGAVKAALVFTFIPLALILFPLGFYIIGFRIFPDLLLGCVNVLAISSVFGLIFVRKMPFSLAMDAATNAGSIFRPLLMLSVPFAFGFLHWRISGSMTMVLLFMSFSVLISWLFFKKVRNLDWKSITP